jgi:hypothetical protein
MVASSVTAEIEMRTVERRNQPNALLTSFLGWTFDAFDFFMLAFCADFFRG